MQPTGRFFLKCLMLAACGANVSQYCFEYKIDSSKQANESTQADIIQHLKSTNYDKSIRPGCGGMPIEVDLNIYLESFGNIEEIRMEFEVFMYMRQYWKDERLANVSDKLLVLTGGYITNLWLPDIYCVNARISDLSIPDTKLHSALFLYPDGSVLYSRSSHIVASCEMELYRFPADTQYCSLEFGSYAYPDEELSLKWNVKDVKIAKRNLAQFFVTKSLLSTKTTKYTSGKYTTLRATFVMKRSLGYYLIQVYVPCGFLVMLSWIVFWMSPDDGASRLTVGITTILTIVFLLGYTNSMLPKVSYAKGMDWYLIMSFVFIFLTIVECIAVDKLSKKSARNKKRNSAEDKKQKKTKSNYNRNLQVVFKPRKKDVIKVDQDFKLFSNLSLDEDDRSVVRIIDRNNSGDARRNYQKKKDKESNSKCISCYKIDYWCRVLFPLCFALFNLFYWYGYMIN